MRSLILVVLAAVAVGCATTYEMQGRSGVAPAAMGEVVTTRDDYGNTELKLKIQHLAPADKIASGAKNYVVWIQPEGQTQYQNVGGVIMDRSLSAKYVTRVPHENFRLIVTPEAAINVSMPTGIPVFEQNIRR